MTKTQYNSNNSPPEFIWTSFENRNNLDELINIPTKAEIRFMIQISLSTQGPNSKTGTIRNPRQIHSWFTIHCVFDLPQNSAIRAIFKVKSVDLKTYSPPSSIE